VRVVAIGCLCLASALTSLVLLVMAPAAPAAGLSWSAPVLIENQAPFGVAPPIDSISCPSVSFCVGMEGDGVVVSNRPTGGGTSWIPISFAGVRGYSGARLNALSCSSRHLCVAVDQNELITSTRPDGGPGAWTVHSGPPGVSSISCPVRNLCLAAGGQYLYTTTRPEAGAGAWRRAAIAGVQEVACRGRHLCIAASLTGESDYVLSSTHPTRGGGSWRATLLSYSTLNFSYSGAACPSTRLCVITDSRGNVLSSTHPGQARPRWRLARVPGAGRSVACASQRLCVSVDTGTIATSTHPSGGARSWSVTGWASGPSGVPHVACGASSVCVVVDERDDVLASSNPAAGARSYQPVNLGQGYTPLSSVACPSASFCVASGYDGRLLRSTDPTGGLAGWTQPGSAAKTAAWTAGLSCPSEHFCGGVSGAGTISVGDPTLDPQTWVPGPSLQYFYPGGAISCPSAALCVAGDGQGGVVSSTNPAGGAPAWRSAELNAPQNCGKYGCQYTPLTGLSCPSTSFCAGIDQQGGFWTSADPGSGAWAKSASAAGGSVLTCPDTSMCVTAAAGWVAVTTDPAAPDPSWSVTPLPSFSSPITIVPGSPPLPASISGLGCVSVHLCVAVDANLGYAFTGDPSASGQPWSATKLDITRSNPFTGPASLTGISCTQTGLCVAIDGTGHILTAESPASQNAR
jgi:hypothetical protein